VLVLDRSLEGAPIPSSYLECLVRLNTYDWTRRLWTLQGGRLPKFVFVQIGKGAPINLRSLVACSPGSAPEDRKTFTEQPGLSAMWQETIERTLDFCSDNSMGISPSNRGLPENTLPRADESSTLPTSPYGASDGLTRRSRKSSIGFSVGRGLLLACIWKVLQTRSTSKHEDEEICLGTLLDVDMNRLLSS
jgi:hypothetical protein